MNGVQANSRGVSRSFDAFVVSRRNEGEDTASAVASDITHKLKTSRGGVFVPPRTRRLKQRTGSHGSEAKRRGWNISPFASRSRRSGGKLRPRTARNELMLKAPRRRREEEKAKICKHFFFFLDFFFCLFCFTVIVP